MVKKTVSFFYIVRKKGKFALEFIWKIAKKNPLIIKNYQEILLNFKKLSGKFKSHRERNP